MGIGHVGVLHALQNMHRAARFDDAGQNAVVTAIIDERGGEDVRIRP